MIKQNKNINSLIIDCQYFGTINYIKILFEHSNILIEQYESYQKMSFRNRCMIAGSNGVINLSVPLENGRSQKGLTRDVKISYSTNWQVQHWRSIESAYNRSPYFEFYRDGVWGLLQKEEAFLLDLNLKTLDWLKKALKLPVTISLTDAYRKVYPIDTIDKRNQFLPKNHQNHQVGFHYTQVFEDRNGFIPNLSILDLLFCSGPLAKTLLIDNKSAH